MQALSGDNLTSCLFHLLPLSLQYARSQQHPVAQHKHVQVNLSLGIPLLENGRDNTFFITIPSISVEMSASPESEGLICARPDPNKDFM